MPEKKKKIDTNSQASLQLTREDTCPPDFISLLREPIVNEPLPSNFNAAEEAAHLTELWRTLPKFKEYSFDTFVHAGGSGMVFKVRRQSTDTILALKVASVVSQ